MAKEKQAQEEEWDVSAYLQREAKRHEKVEPQWFTNPETRERFLIRPMGGMAFVVAGKMQHLLTDDAVDGWKQNGLKVEAHESDDEDEEGEEREDLATAIAKGDQNAETIARVILKTCVKPRLVLKPSKPGEMSIFSVGPKDLIFLYRAATGLYIADDAKVPLKGGESTTVATIKSVSKRSGKGSRTLGRG